MSKPKKRKLTPRQRRAVGAAIELFEIEEAEFWAERKARQQRIQGEFYQAVLNLQATLKVVGKTQRAYEQA